MKKEKRELLKNFKAVIKDLLDNYESYTEEEQAKIKEIFQKAVDLNNDLDKYDDAKDQFWADFFNAYNQFFNPLDY